MNDDTCCSTPLYSHPNSIKEDHRVISPQEGRRGRVVTPPPLKRLYSVDEAAHYLGVSTWQVRDMIDNGTLPSVRIGKRKLVDIEDLETFVRRHKEGGDGEHLLPKGQ